MSHTTLQDSSASETCEYSMAQPAGIEYSGGWGAQRGMHSTIYFPATSIHLQISQDLFICLQG